jgi:murein DD-endopeptidase MepM/ murein hydrolase activator NlpD
MGEKRIMVVSHAGLWFAVVGIGLDTVPGENIIEFQDGGAAPQQLKFTLQSKEYATQSLTIQNPELVNPTPAELRRIEREQLHLDKVVSHWRNTSHPGIAFVWPAQGPETSGFGLRRVLNGEPRSPHSGIDIGAPTGTPLRAPADGVVADVGHYYYCGKTLTIDLGQGLFSVYCHMSKIKVHPGQRVKQGQIVGAIGATGRTTGPNLHWTVRLNGAAVDPHAFLGANAPAPKVATASAPAAASMKAPPKAATLTSPAAASTGN